MKTIESTTAEKIPVEVTTSSDPTGTPPDFAVGAVGVNDPVTWVAGTWVGTWDTTTGRATALSPLVGAGQALAVTGIGATWRMWIRWRLVGGETPVYAPGVLQVV